MKTFVNILILLVFIHFLSCISGVKNNKKGTTYKDCDSCNYIQSSYYQLIYEADIAYLEGDKNLSYELITAAKEKCPLIEQPMYYEISNYIELLIERGENEEAIAYIRQLVQKYGYYPDFFEGEDYFITLKNAVDWDAVKKNLQADCDKFYSKIDTNLVNTLLKMQRDDQLVRNRQSYTAEDIRKMEAVDSVNQEKLKVIFETYGYPDEKLFGQKYNIPPNRLDISTLLFHFMTHRILSLFC